MNDLETLRLIDILGRIRRNFRNLMPVSDREGVWNAVSYLIGSEIRGKIVTISALCEATDLPYATARRLVQDLIKRRLVIKTPRGGASRSFSLHPSKDLISRFHVYGRRVKATFAEILMAAGAGDDHDSYYFGGTARSITSPADMSRTGAKFLLYGDHYTSAIRNSFVDFRSRYGSAKDFTILPFEDVYKELRANGARIVSRYDVIGTCLPWMGELIARGLVRPIPEIGRLALPDPEMRNITEAGYALPLYNTAHIFAARTDLFSGAGRTLPRTPEQVIAAAKALHRPRSQRYGIVWDAGQGTPLAHSFMFFLGAFGAPILSQRQAWATDPFAPSVRDQLVATLESDAAAQTLDFMQRLLEVSPPNALDLAWGDASSVFLLGKAAMSYSWSMWAARFEYDSRSVVKGRTTYLPYPTARGKAVVPGSAFLLAIPSNIPPERVPIALAAIETIVRHGGNLKPGEGRFGPDFGSSADPEMKPGNKVVNAVAKWSAEGRLERWYRPAVPQFHAIQTILGKQLYAALRKERSTTQALRDAASKLGRARTENYHAAA